MYKIKFEAHDSGECAVAIEPLAHSVLTLVGMSLIVLRIDPALAAVSMAVVPLVYWCTGYYGKRVEPRLLHSRGMEAMNLTLVNDTMTMLPVVSAFNGQRREHRNFVQHGRNTVKARIAVTVRQ